MNKNKLSNHIIFVLPSLRGGGAERVFVQLANKFVSEGLQVSLILFENVGPLVSFLDNRVSLYSLNVSKARYAYKPLKKCINRLSATAIFGTHDRVNILLGLMAKSLLNRPKVYVRQTNVLSIFINKNTIFKRLLLKYVYQFTYNRASGVISQCYEMKEDLYGTLELSKTSIHVIYNPVDIDHITSFMIKENPYIPNKNVIVAAGRLSDQKDFTTLIKAFNIINQNDKNTLLYILGEGPQLESLKQLTKTLQLDQFVYFKGFVSNPYQYFYHANLFVLSSRFEGFPNVLLEALTTGVKVVATACPTGVKEIMENAGLINHLVPVGDPKALAEKIIDLDSEHMIEPDMSRYSLDTIANQYARLIN